MIQKYIEAFNSKYLPRLEKLDRYYKAENDGIMNRTFTNPDAPNVKIATSFAKLIADITSSYFLGKPVVYNSQEKEFLDNISSIFNYNDEQAENGILALNQSVFGHAVEMLYMDEESQIRFKDVDSRSCILIYENTIEQKLLYCIRVYYNNDILTNEKIMYVEVYSKDTIQYYEGTEKGDLTFIEEVEHYWNDVPFVVYKNNPSSTGDFEHLIPIINAMDFQISDIQNLNMSFNDAYLVWTNAGESMNEVIAQQMTETRNIFLNSDIESITPTLDFLIKHADIQGSEANMNRLHNLIHELSYVDDLSSETAKSHQSATQSRLSMMSLEQNVAKKEQFFKYGLQRRIELICNILSFKLQEFDYRNITMNFQRNLPISNLEIADVVSKLRGIVSNESLISIIPFVQDVALEKARLAKENELNSYANVFGVEVDEQSTVLEE